MLLLGGPAISAWTHGSVLVRGEVLVQVPTPPVMAIALSLNSLILKVVMPTASCLGKYVRFKPLRAVEEETCYLGSLHL